MTPQPAAVDVEPPEARAALRQVGGDRPVLQEVGAVVEDPPEPALVDQLLGQRDGRHAAVVVPDDVRHAGLLDRLAHLLRPRRRSSPAASRRGSSCRPRPRRWRSPRAGCSARRCRSRRCRRARRASASRSRPTRSPTCRRTPWPRPRCGAQTALSTGWYVEVEEVADLAVGVRVGPAHEAVADHADVERFLRAHRCSSALRSLASSRGRRAPRSSRRGCRSRSRGSMHDLVGEHAAVPADVLECLGQLAVVVAQPVAGVLGDVELAVRVVRQAVAAGLVVGARALDRGVVLGDVEVDRPRAQRRRSACVGRVERLAVVPVEVLRAGCGLPGAL